MTEALLEAIDTTNLLEEGSYEWKYVGRLKQWALENGYVIHSWTGSASLGTEEGGAYAMDKNKFYKIVFKSKGSEVKCVIAICEAIYKRIENAK